MAKNIENDFSFYSENNVKFSMEAFVRRDQPDKYEDWLKGKDFGSHPIAKSGAGSYAPAPCLDDLKCVKT
jgi:jumonji domain-containing protein 2